jgi:hypothetical protein
MRCGDNRDTSERESGMNDHNNRSGVMVPPRHPEWEVWGTPMLDGGEGKHKVVENDQFCQQEELVGDATTPNKRRRRQKKGEEEACNNEGSEG